MSNNDAHAEMFDLIGGGPLGHPKIFINLVRATSLLRVLSDVGP